MTIDILSRDAAARRARWSTPDGRVLATPLVLYVETPRASAPDFAEVVVSERPPSGPALWVQERGSVFYPTARDEGALVAIAPELAYTPAGGEELRASGAAENRAVAGAGEALVALTAEAPPETASDLVVMGSARALLENPYVFAKRVTELRLAIGHSRLLYAPGCGRPEEIALLAYAGVDVVDSASAVLAASRGELLTPEGGMPVKGLVEAALLPALSRDDLLARNLRAVQGEMERVHWAIALGRLRDLVEQRIRARPELAAHLRRLDKETFDFFEEQAPILRAGPLYATSKESVDRVEIERYRRRIESRYVKPDSARVLVVLPCSARKPYSDSKTHRILDSALQAVRGRSVVHEVVLTSPMGVVPRELERVYPAAHYDLPVTGHWDEDEKAMIRGAMTALVARSRYDAVVVHLDEVEMEIVAPVLGDFTYTVERDPLAPKSLDNLRDALRRITDPMPFLPWGRRVADDIGAIARWQFGERGALALMQGAVARGKWPFLKLLDGETKTQLAMTTPDRGMLSLAVEGGKRLLDAGVHRVEIEDFRPKGTVFAVGVTGADPEVRIEDDVVLHHAGKLKGVGRAMMSAREMVEARRGAAVNVRHYV